MPRIGRIRWMFLCLFMPSLVTAAPLDGVLDPILARARLKAETYGIQIVSLPAGETLYAKNADLPLNPASNIKILTAATALAKLSPDFRFETRVAVSGSDACLIGGGDPSLVDETMWMLVEEARRAGLGRIERDLIVDSTLFPTVRENADTFEGDMDRAFTAPVAALSVNFNSLTLYVTPMDLGGRPSVHLEPDLPIFEVRSRAVTASSGGKRDIGASVDWKGEKGMVALSGRIGVKSDTVAIYRTVPAPALYAGAVFLEHFRRAGGLLKGHVKEGRCPETFSEQVRFRSRPLSEIVSGLDKFSNNFIAEMLLRAVGDEPTPESGLKAVRAWLTSASIPAPELVMENASGLSKKNRVCARTLASVLRTAAADFKIGPEFVSSLSILGVDGSLRKWLKDSEAKALVRAKSGMLSDVVALSGYADTPAHGRLAFSFLFRAAPGQHAALMQLEQSLLTALVAPPKR
ncbi:MAG: D-alanyl-D-alanine carboxypeptidase/D-alanyl-D-alanine-endopeptidase [Pseudomonadota bacterium]